jgi:hypothetical protein
VRETLKNPGLLFVGDSKMAALATRTHVAAGGDYYLCPLPATPRPAAALAALLAPVRAGTQSLTPVWRRNDDTGRKEKIAEGDEDEVPLARAAADGSVTTFTERRRVVRSLAQSRSAGRSLQRRLTAAPHALKQVGQKRHGKTCPQTAAAWRAAVAKIGLRSQVADLLRVSYDVTRRTQQVRAYGQPCKGLNLS